MSKFKVGDEVECTPKQGRHTGAGYKPGRRFIVNHVRVDGMVEPCYWDETGLNGVYESSLMLVAEPEAELSDIKLGTWEVNL